MILFTRSVRAQMAANSDVWTTVLRMSTRTSPWGSPRPEAGCAKSCLGKGWERNLHACFLGLHPSQSMSSSSSSSPKRGVGGGRPFMLWQNRKERSVLTYPCPGDFLLVRGSGPMAVLPLAEKEMKWRDRLCGQKTDPDEAGTSRHGGKPSFNRDKRPIAWLIL